MSRYRVSSYAGPARIPDRCRRRPEERGWPRNIWNVREQADAAAPQVQRQASSERCTRSYRHVHRLARQETLLVKTEALDLVEVGANLVRHDIVTADGKRKKKHVWHGESSRGYTRSWPLCWHWPLRISHRAADYARRDTDDGLI